MKKVYGYTLGGIVVDMFVKIEVSKIPQKYKKSSYIYGTSVKFGNVGGIYFPTDSHVILCLLNIPATEDKT
jgi:hypothetical protein